MTDFPKVPEGILGEETTEKTNTELFLSLVGQYFPEAIKDGEVDFTALKEEMGEFPQVSSEHYDFTWAGKQAAKKEAMSDTYGRTLKYKPQDSLNPDTTENIYIEGDNLEALKLLRRNYHGKIKMIYIDPPYNTGNDFVYHDDFSMTEEELAEKSGDVVDGVRYQKNGKDGSRYHTNWLNMMYPRLKIARELLSDDGVIFISIDDNEQVNLKKICDEIFGSNNAIAVFPRLATKSGKTPLTFMISHDYVLCYTKLKHDIFIGKAFEDDSYKYSDEFESERGRYNLKQPLDCNSISYSASLDYPITYNGITYYPGTDYNKYLERKSGKHLPKDYAWRWSKDLFQFGLENGWIVFQNGRIYTKGYLNATIEKQSNGSYAIIKREKTRKISTIDFISNDYSNDIAKKQLALHEISARFDFPKSINLIKSLITTHYDKNALILDFFSGSATTAEAVIKQNLEDGGNRKFILIQLAEKTQDDTYNTICEIGKERIRRAAKKIHEDNPDAQFDDGFKVFEVADTNIRWNTANDEEIKSLSEMDYGDDKERIDFTKGYTDIDVVYEIMLRQFDIPLSTPVEKLPEVSDRTYIFADAVVVCLEPEITTELIEKLSAIEPTPAKFVLRDSAFNDDIQLKDVSFRRLSALIKNHQTEEERKSKYNNYTVEFI